MKKLQTDLDYVCFSDLTKSLTGQHTEIGEELTIYQGNEANMFFYPRENTCNIPYQSINHLDVEKITQSANPYCIVVSGGNVDINLEKGFSDKLVGLN